MDRANITVNQVSVPGQFEFFEHPFPLILECSSSDDNLAETTRWIESRREHLRGLCGEHGAILFRGFPISSADDLDAFVAAFGDRNFPYDDSLSNAVRVNRTERVFTANEAPPHITIHLHHEMAQTPIFPRRLFFFCEKPAETGGATPICRSDVLLAILQREAPDFVRQCKEKRLKYTHTMPREADLESGMGRSWQSTLRAQSRQQAEDKLGRLGYSWQWLADGSLRVASPVLPAVMKLDSGRESFFNQLIAASQGWKDSRNDPSNAITLGDDTPLDRNGVTLAAELTEQITFDIPWQQGDVTLVDNFVTMHGRRTFSGSRSVLASLVIGA